MRSPRNILYGLVASLLLFSLSVAMQKTLFSRAPGAGGDLSSSTARGGSRPSSIAVASSRAEDDESDDPGANDTHRFIAARRGGPAASENAGPVPDQTIPATPTSARGQAASDPRNGTGWFSPLSALSRLVFPGGGAAPAPTAATPSSAGSSSGSPARNQVKEVFFGTDKNMVCQPGGRQFTLGPEEDVYVCVIWQGLAGSYAEQLTFVAPDGHVYQTVTVPFETAGATLSNGETLVVGALPVAGTFIRQRALVGLWTVKVGLNGQVLTEDSFELLLQ